MCRYAVLVYVDRARRSSRYVLCLQAVWPASLLYHIERKRGKKRTTRENSMLRKRPLFVAGRDGYHLICKGVCECASSDWLAVSGRRGARRKHRGRPHTCAERGLDGALLRGLTGPVLRDCVSGKTSASWAQWACEGVAGAREGEGGRARGRETEEGVKNRRRFSSCSDRKKAEDGDRGSRGVITSQLKTQIRMYRHHQEALRRQEILVSDKRRACQAQSEECRLQNANKEWRTITNSG